MHINKIQIKNFRLLQDTTLDMRKDLSLLLGRNNSGKTSFMVIFEKFYKAFSFSYNDFPLSLRNKITNIEKHNENISIEMRLEIEYEDTDNLENLSEFILDLDIDCRTVKIFFEVSIDRLKLMNKLQDMKREDRERFLIKHLPPLLSKKIYIYENENDIKQRNLIEKKLEDIKKIINFQIIHAKRNVSSSEEKSDKKKVLSALTTQYFNQKNKDTDFDEINKTMIEMDDILNKIYHDNFTPFMKNAKDFLNISDLKVVSNLESKELVQHLSHLIYGSEKNYLPEHLNGLGYMNILYLLLNIQMIKESFDEEERSINLFFIEEPEAHTHQQMQYVFIKQIKKILKGIKGLQTVISTHSAHIVSQCDFEDIRYFFNHNGKVKIKNFHEELKGKYGKEKDDFKFLTQYLTLNTSELFFASKIIFIEGTSERFLLPYFIKEYDKNNSCEESLSNQNISILEVGANGRAFKHFLEFLEIKTLIITDIDTTKEEKNAKNKTVYTSAEVKDSTHTSNYTLKYYLNAPELKEKKEFGEWMQKLKKNELQKNDKNIKVAYQIEENGYHARSFEDAFIAINLENIKNNVGNEEENDNLSGLKKIEKIKKFIDSNNNDYYTLTKEILKLDGKSDFASSIVYLGFTKNIKWKTPKYIEEGLKWIAK